MSDMSRFSISWRILTQMLHTYVVNCCNMPCELWYLGWSDGNITWLTWLTWLQVAPACRGAEPSREGQSCTGASPKYVVRRSSHAQYKFSTSSVHYWIISLHFYHFSLWPLCLFASMTHSTHSRHSRHSRHLSLQNRCYPMLPVRTFTTLMTSTTSLESPLMWQGDFSNFLSANRDPPWPHGSRKHKEITQKIQILSR